MIKKIIILCLLLFTLTGCSIDYNINIDDNYNVVENIKVFEQENLISRNKVEQLMDKYIALDDEDYVTQRDYYVRFKNTTIDYTNGNTMFINRNFNSFDNYQYSDLLSYFTVDRTIDEYNTSYLFYISYINYDKINSIVNDATLNDFNLNVNISTNHLVYENNADQVNSNTYTWNIDKDNYHDKTIKMVIEKQTEEELASKQGINWSKILFIVLIVLLILGLLIWMFIKFSMKKRDKI